MAEMIPGTFAGNNSAERWTFNFLREHLTPHEDWIVWHQSTAVRRTPDFVVWSAHLGLLIIEVKGWTLDHISLVDPLHWRVVYRNGPEIKENPLKQADVYLDLYRDEARRHPGLRNTEGKYMGHPKFPVASCVLFPYMTRRDALASDLKDGLSSCRYLFRDDIDPDHTSSPGTGGVFQALKRPFTGFLFPSSSMGAEEVGQLRAMMFPKANAERVHHRTAPPERRKFTTPAPRKAYVPVIAQGTESAAVQLLQKELVPIKSQLSHPRQVQVIVQREPSTLYAPRAALLEQHGIYPKRRNRWNVFRSRPVAFFMLLLFMWMTFIVYARLSSLDWPKLPQWNNTVMTAPEKKRTAHAARKVHHRREPYPASPIN